MDESNNQPVPKLYKHCKRCGRKLKNFDAMQKGYGVVCEKKMRYVNNKRLFQTCIREHIDWRGNSI